MRQTLSILLVLNFLCPISALAKCNFKTIKKVEDGYLYTSDCHREVGKLKNEAEERREQVKNLNEAIKLKDLTITTHTERADLWMNTSFKLEDRVNTIERMNSTNRWLYFGIGVIFTGLSVWGAGQLR